MESKSDQRKFELGINNEKVRLIISQNILLPDRGQEFSYFEFLKGKGEYVHTYNLLYIIGWGRGVGGWECMRFWAKKYLFSLHSKVRSLLPE